MKAFVCLLIITIFVVSCQQSKSEKKAERVLTESERIAKVYEAVDDRLSEAKEEIVLLSEIRKIPFDTLNLMLRDYLAETDTLSAFDKNSEVLIARAIARVSNKYKIPRARLASLIFSFKYEMLTKEDIEASAIEEFEENYEPEVEYEPEDTY